MQNNSHVFIVNNIKLPIDASIQEAFSVAKQKCKKANINTDSATFAIYKKSIDARNKNDIKFVYSVSVKTVSMPPKKEIAEALGITLFEENELTAISSGTEKLSFNPLVAGSGPAGLFCALYLAECGFKPVLIERGGSVKERKKAVSDFNQKQILNTETNIQFGAGGAGTFSDGKLVTRINDPLCSYVLKRLVDFGAPEEILYLSRPHVGTDILSGIVEKILLRIEELGGKVMYSTRLISFDERNGNGIAKTSAGDIPYGVLVLATGHSARDVYDELLNSGFSVAPKQFSVGMRIEHSAEQIDKALYGNYAGNPLLGHAEYNLSYNTKVRGVYTFCMCPGGEVIASASENDSCVVNGMSYHKRDGKNSNSAVLCTVFKEDYGDDPRLAIEFQRKIESAAFSAGGGGYKAPVVTVGDFLSDKESAEPTSVLPTYMGGKNISIASPKRYLPKFVNDSIKDAILEFDKKIRGFADRRAILTGAETRSSAPVRILRDPESRLALGKRNIYPCGEGAGYAGGITSAAVDGLKTAIKIAMVYKP